MFLYGTKVKANAALSTNHTLYHINKILEETDAVDKAEDEKFGESEHADQLPKELTDPKERINGSIQGAMLPGLSQDYALESFICLFVLARLVSPLRKTCEASIPDRV